MAAQQPKKRPWYLVAALLGAMALGLSGGYRGCEVWAFYHGDIDRSSLVRELQSDADRDSVGAAWDKLVAAYDVARPREFPMGVAMLLVSGALVLFAMRGMAGRSSARNLVLQLVLVQAALYVAEFFMTKDIRAATLDVGAAQQLAKHEPEADQLMPYSMMFARWVLALFVAGRSVVAMLIVYALTRPGSREFFEATSDPAVEQ